MVIPAYNVGKLLGRAVESVRAQSCGDWHLIIVDDCSTDDTGRLARELCASDSRMRYVSTEANGGSAMPARIKGVELADTEWIILLDDDDALAPDYISQMLKIQRETGADIVTSVMKTPDGTMIPKEDINRNSLLSGHEAALCSIGVWKINFNGALQRRDDYLRAIPLLDNRWENSYLDEYLTRILLAGAVKVATSDVIYHFGRNDKSITRTPNHRRHLYVDNMHRLASYFQDDRELSLASAVAHFHYLIDTIRIHRDDPEPDPEEYRKTEEFIREQYRHVDFGRIKGHVSRKYYLVMRAGLSAARFILGITDRLRR